ncbi:MAG: hypothetical protein KF730_10660 [Sphingomonas sp.]|uniref:hypothetical protein n=1 Tax=Sphingomonas sp. TaxID=28214 RepID=UPI0025D8F831|nr:hypothetical protein [Sphingomonas sp.]MBX3565023.1 hypothetical protein [Sphingomonas sp.]
MKTLGMIAAAAAAMLLAPAASAAPVSAPAAPATVTAASVAASSQVRVVVREQRHRHRGWRKHGRRAYWRTVCTRRWHHGRSTRVCRRVRAWR